MAFISYDKLWESEVCNNVSAKPRVQNININKIDLNGNDTYKNDEKITTHFETSNTQDVLTRLYIDGKLSKVERLLSFLEKEYNEFKVNGRSNKQTDEEFSFQRAVKTTTQMPYDKGFVPDYQIAGEVLKHYLLIEVNERRRPDLDPLKDNIIQGFHP